jgi:HEAT repeat protein
LPQFGARAVPLVLAGLSSSELAERRMAASAMAQMADPRLVAPIGGLLSDPDADIRANACASAMTNWDSEFAPQVVQLLSDQSSKVRAAAQFCLQDHPTESATHVAAYRKLVENGGPAASSAMGLLRFHRVQLPKESLIPFLSSTDPCTVALALWDLGDRRLELDEISPLLANSLPMARFRGLAALLQIANQEATDRIVSMLRDPHEGLRWTARTFLRRLSGRKLGADPAAWEQWWAENKKTFKPAPLVWPTSERK